MPSKLLLTLATVGLLAPFSAAAGANEEQVTSITQFSDLRPTDWAYQALGNLAERYGCVAG